MHMKTSTKPRTKPMRFGAVKWDSQFGSRGRKQPKRKWEAAKKRHLQSREENYSARGLLRVEDFPISNITEEIYDFTIKLYDTI